MLPPAYTGNATLDAIAQVSGAALPSRAVEWWLLIAFGFVFTCLRVYGRIHVSGVRGLGWDDYLACIAVICYGILIMVTYLICVPYLGIANDSMPADWRDRLGRDPGSMEYHLRVVGSKLQLLCWMAYGTSLWALKAALLCFFASRLTLDLQGRMTWIYVCAGLIGGTWVTLVLITFLSCRPLYKMWQIWPDPGEICYASNSPILVWGYWVCNIVTDIYLILIPLPVLLRTSLTSKQKFALVTLFSCTIGITIFGVARLVLIELDSSTNADGVWAVREVFVATITTNLAPVVPIIRRFLSFITGRSDSRASSQRTSPRQWSTPRSWVRWHKRKMMGSDGTETTLVNSRSLSTSAYLTRNDVIYPYPGEFEMLRIWPRGDG